jgi:hypothetical protein
VKKKTILVNHTSGEVKMEVIFNKRGEKFILLEQRWPTRGTRATICPRWQYSREVKTVSLLFDSDETVGQGYIMHYHSEE